MNRKQLIGLTSIAVITGGLLAGCGQEPQAKPTQKVAVKKEMEKSLAAQGYTIQAIQSYDDVNVVTLQREGKNYVGTVDNDFNWLIHPTNQYETLEFHDGLAAFSVPEKRKMILANDSKAELWGFMDKTGKVIIKPQFRNVQPFADGVAIVETVEKDRDDFANARTVVIDQTGKEVGQIRDKHLYTEEMEEGKTVESYTGGYAYAKEGFYDKKGTFTPMKLDRQEYIVLDGKRFEDDGKDNVGVFAKSIAGEQLNQFTSNGEELDVYDVEANHPETFDQLAKNNSVLIDGTEDNKYLVDASSMNVLLRGNIQTGLAQDFLFIPDATAQNNDTVRTGTFFDYNGKKAATVRDMTGPLLNDRYFVQGNEYYKLVDTDGNVLVDENKKITQVEFAMEKNSSKPYSFNPVVHIQYRENANDTKPNDGLLNVKTKKMVDYKKLLELKTIPMKD